MIYNALFSRLSVQVLFLWIFIIIIVYLIYLPYDNTSSVYIQNPSNDIDAIVFIAMGKLAQEYVTDNAISSVRNIGKWKGDIYIITDFESCFSETKITNDVKIVEIAPIGTLMEIKALKAKLMYLLPAHVNSALYMDVDILVSKRLDFFFNDVHYAIEQIRNRNKDNQPDFGMFLDAGGHFFGFCSGCEKWHTGVIYLSRDSGKSCLQEWEKVILSGKYDTDQQSIDDVYNRGYCPNALVLPSKHLLFAKDYFALFLTPSRTFIHLTSINRLDSQDFFYTKYVVPNLRSSLENRYHNIFATSKEMIAAKQNCIKTF